MKKHYYSKLTAVEKGCYNKILKGIRCGDLMIRVSPFMDSEKMTNIITSVKYDHPEIFYVNFNDLKFIKTPIEIVYQVNYTVKVVLRKDFIKEFNTKINSIVNEANGQNLKDDYEKCRWVHNYLVKNVRYNYDALRQPDKYPDSFGVRGVFYDKLAVCEGVSKAFKVLCDRLGVETLIAFGTASLEGIGIGMPHAWNIVCLDGQFSHIDVTWDMGMSQTSKYTRFDYFCLPDRYMKVDHVYEKLPECVTDSFSYFRKRNRWFSCRKQLQGYLEAELKKGVMVLYFKAESKKDKTELLAKKIQDQVNQAISEYYKNSYYIEIIPNEKQMCFFFRIKTVIGGEMLEQ